MNTFSKNLKIFRLIAITIVIALGISGAYNLLSSNAVNTLGSLTEVPNAEEITDETKIPAKYTFFPEIQKDSKGNQITIATPFGNWDRVNAGVIQDGTMEYIPGIANVVWIDKDDTSYDGKIGMTYNNIGKYNDKTVSLKVTYMGSSENCTPNGFGLIMYNDKLGIRTSLTPEQIHIKYEFFDAATGDPLQVAGYQEFQDIDSYQGIKIENYDKIYYDTSAKDHFKYGTNGEVKDFIITEDGSNITSQDLKTRIAYTFDASEINFTWSTNAFYYKHIKNQNIGTGKAYVGLTEDESIDVLLGTYYYVDADGNICDKDDEGATRRIAVNTLQACSNKMVPSEFAKPIKFVSDENGVELENATFKKGDEVYFSIVFNVPGELSNNYFKSYAIVDELVNCFTINTNDVKVINNGTGEKFTPLYNISVVDNKLTIAAKDDWVTNSNFYAKSYKAIFKVSIKENADLRNYLDGEVYKVPNTPQLIVDGSTINGDTVKVNVTEQPSLSIYKESDKSTYKVGQTANYTVEVEQTTKNAIAKNVTISDIFDYKNPIEWKEFTLSKDLTDVAKHTWTYKSNTYYSNGTNQYLLKGNKWVKKEWKFVDPDNESRVFSNELNGENVWTSGIYAFYFDGTNQFVLSNDGVTWEIDKYLRGGQVPSVNFYGKNIWTDSSHAYYTNTDPSNGHIGYYVFGTNGDYWTAITWENITDLNPDYIWSDNGNIYYTYDGTDSGVLASVGNYKFNTSTQKWEVSPFTGLTGINGKQVWTDGQNTYYSNGDKQYVLRGSEWIVKDWDKSPSQMKGEFVWNGDNYVAYSDGNKDYKLIENSFEIKDFKAVDKDGNNLHLDIEDGIVETGLDLKYGEKIVLTYSIDLKDETLVDTTIKNTAIVDADNTDVRAKSANFISVESQKPALNVVKSSDKEEYYRGDTINYEAEIEQMIDGVSAKELLIVDEISRTDLILVEDSVKLLDENNEEVEFNLESGNGIITITTDHELDFGKKLKLKYSYKIPEDISLSFENIVSNDISVSAKDAEKVEDFNNVMILNPVLDITKKSDKTQYGNMDTINYEVVVKQISDTGVAKDVVITDTFDKDIAGNLFNISVFLTTPHIAHELSGTEVEKNGSTLTIKTNHDLQNDETLTIRYSVLQLFTNLDGQTIKNKAVATSDTTLSVSAEATVSVLAPELSISKKSDKTSYENTDTAKYTIEVENQNPEAYIKNFVLTDRFDVDNISDKLQNFKVEKVDSLSLTTEDYTDYVFEETDNKDGFKLTANNALQLKMGQKLVITYDIDLTDVPDVSHLENTATIKASNVQNMLFATNLVNIIDVSKVNLEVNKTTDKETYYRGETIEYTVEVTHNVTGKTANNIKITDTMNNNFTLDQDGIKVIRNDNTEVEDFTIDIDGNVLTINTNEDLGEGDYLTFIYSYEIPSDFVMGSKIQVRNDVTAEGEGANPTTATAYVDIVKPELTVSKNADKKNYNNLETVKYTISVTNQTEDSVAKNIVINDILDSEIANNITDIKAFVIADANSTPLDINPSKDADTLTIDTGYDLKDNETLVINYSLPLKGLNLEGKSMRNSVNVTSTTANTGSDNETINVLRPEITLVKSSDKDIYASSEVVKYTIEVKQLSTNSEARNIVLNDVFDKDIADKVENIKVVVVEGNNTTNIDNFDVGKNENTFNIKTKQNINDNQTLMITYDLPLSEVGFNSGSIKNTATITTDNTDEKVFIKTIDIVGPTLTVEKTADKEIYDKSETVKYTVKVNQTVENAEAGNVVMTDKLDAEVANTIKNIKVVLIDGNNKTDVTDFEVIKDKDTFVIKTNQSIKRGQSLEISYDLPLNSQTIGTGHFNNTVSVMADNASEVTDDEVIQVYKPELMIEKTVEKPVYTNLETAKYTIKVNQLTRLVKAKDVVITDILEAQGVGNIENVKVSITKDDQTNDIENVQTSVNDDAFIIETGHSLADNETMIITYDLPLADFENEQVKNTATASAVNADDVDASSNIQVLKPILNIKKTTDKKVYGNTETVKYRVEVEQITDTVYAKDVVISDTLNKDLVEEIIDINVELINGDETTTIDDYRFKKDENTFKIETGHNLEKGEKLVITYELPLKGLGLENQTIKNVATVDAENADKTTTPEVEVSIVAPELKVVKSSDKETYTNLETAKYTIKINQTIEGSEVENVVVTDTLDKNIADKIKNIEVVIVQGDEEISTLEDFEFVTENNTFTLDTKTNLKYGEELVITYDLPLNSNLEGKTIKNNVVVKSDNTEDINAEEVEISVIEPKIEVEKTSNKETYTNLETIKYTVKVKQTVENSEAKNIVVSDVLDKDIADKITNLKVIVVDDNKTSDIEGFVLTQDKNTSNIETKTNLKYGEELVITYDLPLNELGLEGKTIKNVANVTTDNTDSESTKEVVTNIVKPELSIEKATDKKTYGNTETVKYTVKVKQTVENSEAKNIVVSDVLDKDIADKVKNIKVVISKGNKSTDVKNVEIAKNKNTIDLKTNTNLKHGEELVITYDLPLNELGLEGKTIKNVANVKADNTDTVGTDEDVTITITNPKLSITKATDKKTYGNTETVKYTVKVKQTVENSEAKNVVISDTLDKDVAKLIKNVKVAISNGKTSTEVKNFVFTANEKSFTLDTKSNLSNDETLVITYELDLKGLNLEGKTIKNIAIAKSDNTEPTPESEDVTVKVVKPELKVEKTTDKEIYGNVETVKYTIKVKQTVENSEAKNIVVSDVLDKDIADKVTGIKVSIVEDERTTNVDDFKFVQDKNTLNIDTKQNLKANQTLVIKYELSVKGLNLEGKDIKNTATVKSDNAEPVKASATISVGKPELKVEKIADKELYNVNEPIRYNVEITQTTKGSVKKDIVITDTLNTKDFVINKDTITLTDKSGAVDFEVEMTEMGFVLTVDKNYELNDENKLIVSYTVKTINPETNVNEVTNTVKVNDIVEEKSVKIEHDAKLIVVKEANTEICKPGETVAYKLTVSQPAMNAVAKDVIVTDTLDKENLTFVKNSFKVFDSKGKEVKDFTIEITKNTFVIKTGIDLAKDESLTITYNVKMNVPNNTSVMNVASATSGNITSNESNCVVKVVSPTLNVVKKADKKNYFLGERPKYTILVEQVTENTVANNIVITDVIEKGKKVELVKNSIRLVDDSGNKVDFKYTFKDNVLKITTSKSLAYDESLTLTYQVKLKDKSLINTTIKNTATASSGDVSASASTTIKVNPKPTVPTKNEKVDTKRPQTGDTSNMLLFGGLFIIALIGTAVVVRKLNK